jgi:hypothetical protein
MKRILLTSLVLVAFLVSYCGNGSVKSASDSASTKNATGKSEILFREYQHDFGKVTEGEKISYVFTFINKGTENLSIFSATTTCGCTVPSYDKNPVPPGSAGNLEVVFDTSGRSGMQTKTITVKSNASTPVVLLKITAEVVTTNK